MIHPTAIVHPDAILEEGVQVGPYSIIYGNVYLGANSIVHERVTIGSDSLDAESKATNLGANALIRSGSVIYGGVVARDNLHVGHNAVIREGTVLGDDCSIGSGTQLQGFSKIGNRVRLHSNVHFGELASIEDDVWIFSNVLVTNDPNPPSQMRLGCQLGKETIVLPGTIFMPGITIGAQSVVLPMSKVTRSFQAEKSLIGGMPARLLGPTSMIKMSNDRSKPAYPWIDRFQR